MRIILINNLYTPNIVGGAERSVEVLAKGLQGKGCEVLIITLGPLNDTSNGVASINYPRLLDVWPVKKNRSTIERLYFQFSGDLGLNNLTRKLSILLEDFKPNALHTNNLAGIGDSVWEIASNKNIPVIHTIRDYFQVCAKQNMMNKNGNCSHQCLKCKILTCTRQYKSKFVSHVVGNSNFTLQAHLKEGYFKNATSSVISGGLGDDYLNCTEVKPSTNHIGYIGQIIPSKGIEDILELAVRTNTPTKIAGSDDNEYAKKLKSKYSQYKNISWLGHANAINFYRSIDVLVVTSIWAEPLPRVIYEAMSQGVAILATNVGGNPEIMTGELSNFLYEPGDIETLIQKYNLLRESITDDFILNLIKESKRFSSDQVSNKYLTIYKELTND